MIDLSNDELIVLKKLCHEDTFGNRSYGLPSQTNAIIKTYGFHKSLLEKLIEVELIQKPEFKTYDLAVLNNKRRFLNSSIDWQLPKDNLFAYIINPFYVNNGDEIQNIDTGGRWVYHASIYSVFRDEDNNLKVKFEQFPINIKEKLLSHYKK